MDPLLGEPASLVLGPGLCWCLPRTTPFSARTWADRVMVGGPNEDHHRRMGMEAAAEEHDLVGVADGGFGSQAYCSCGWRTAPKDCGWDASVLWHAHVTARVTARVLETH